ncbi:hypothetical protein ACGFIY_20395 [Micromonospora chersina]|uniref:hypothetical protein n=1 Tax=Micromonospora chersina TaxID=47854 RepID=UPI0037200FCB
MPAPSQPAARPTSPNDATAPERATNTVPAASEAAAHAAPAAPEPAGHAVPATPAGATPGGSAAPALRADQRPPDTAPRPTGPEPANLGDLPEPGDRGDLPTATNDNPPRSDERRSGRPHRSPTTPPTEPPSDHRRPPPPPGRPTAPQPDDPGDQPPGANDNPPRSRKWRRGAVHATDIPTATEPGATALPREPGRGHRHRRAATTASQPVGAAVRRPLADPRAGRRPAAPVEPPAGPELDGTDDPPEQPTRRRAALVALAAAATASAAALVAGLLSWSPEPAEPAETVRPLTAAEAERLAALRVTNQRDVRAGVRVTLGAGGGRTELVGWVDWARPLVYLDVGGPGAGAERGLVQGTASTLLVRPDPAATPTPAPPPLVPPDDRWRLRELPAGRGLPAVRDLLLGLGATQVDPLTAEARWLRRETVDGVPVDVLQAPLPPLQGAGLAPDRRPRLWVDRDARLHRLAGWLPDGTPVTVELARSDRPTLRPVDALGGRPGLPRALSDGEADRLAELPDRLRAAGGAALTVTAPSGDLRGSGWLSWAGSAAYLSVVDADDPGRRTLVRARPGSVARLVVPAGAAAPPLPAPDGLVRAAGRPPGDDVERLVDAALRGVATAVPATAAVRVRDDRVADRTVDVIEVRGRLRWWIDRGGLPRRLELRTGRGVWVQLDLAPGRVPALPGAERPVRKPAKRR